MYTELTRALNSKVTCMYFTVTSRCNAFCDFCWNWKNVESAGKLYKLGEPVKRKELDLEEIDRLTKNLPDMLLVDLYGGEPFIRDDLYEIIKLFHDKCHTKYFSIPTNAIFTDRIKSVLGRAVKDFPDSFFRISISIDGPPEVHNRIRKLKDGYRRAIESAEYIANLREQYPNISLSLNSVYDNKSQSYMEEYLEGMMEYGLFDNICMGIVRGETYDPSLVEVDVDRYFRLKRKLENYKPMNAQPFSPLQRAIEEKTKNIIEDRIRRPEAERNFKCFAAKKFILLDDEGEVFPCEHLMGKSLGNIRDYDYNLQKLIDDSQALQARKDIAAKKCNCSWDCAINTSSVFNGGSYPGTIARMSRIILKEALKKES